MPGSSKEDILLCHSELRTILDTEAWDRKNQAIATYLKNTPNPVNIVDLTTILSFIRDDDGKSEILFGWLKNLGNRVDFATLTDGILPLVRDDLGKSHIISTWLKEPGNIVAFVTLKESILPLVEKSFAKSIIASAWIKEPANVVDVVTLKDEILPLVNNNLARRTIVSAWLEKPGNMVDPAVFSSILSLIQENAHSKAHVATYWLRNSANVIDFVTLKDRILPLVQEDPLIKDDFIKCTIISAWLINTNTMVDVATLTGGILPLVENDDTKSSIVSAWLTTQPNELKLKLFFELADNDVFGSRYNYENIAKAFSLLNPPVEKISDLCQALYPHDEHSQVELFNTFIALGEIQETDVGLIKSFITSLKRDRSVYKVLHIADRKLKLAPKYIFEITSERVSSHYESITEILKVKTLDDALTPEGLQTVQRYLDGTNYAIPLVSLLLFYKVINNIDSFIKKIKPEVLADIRANYSPTAENAFIQQEEYAKLKTLVESELPPMADLCSYLKTKVQPVPQLNAEAIEVYQINFDNVVSVAEEQKATINEQFKSLLRNDSPTADEVAVFFKAALNLDEEITGTNFRGEDKKDLLLSVFMSNKHELAYLFSQEGGLGNFTACIGSLADGCVANIATQVRSAINSALISEPHDQVLYSCFSENIAHPIMMSGGDHTHAAGTTYDILSNSSVTSAFISPNGLVAKLTKQFYDGANIVRNPRPVLEQAMAGESMTGLLEILGNDADTLNQRVAEFAVYFILKLAMPSLLDNPHIKAFKDKCEQTLLQTEEYVKSEEFQEYRRLEREL